MNPCIRILEQAATGIVLVALGPVIGLMYVAILLHKLSHPAACFESDSTCDASLVYSLAWPSPLDDSRRCDDLPIGL